MAHLNAYLNDCIAYGFEGGPNFATQIIQLQNGREKRNALWAQAKHRYSASFLNISSEAYKELKRLHLVCRGQLHAFRFNDPLDNHVEDIENFAQGDGTTRSFQLSKTSVIDGVSYTRGIYAPIDNDDFEVYINNVLTNQYTLDADRGIITFTGTNAPQIGDVIGWRGYFDVWVRFEQDDLPFTLDGPNARNGQVNLVEVAPPLLEEE